MTSNDMLCLSLQDFINAPSKAESLLDLLTSEQILAIEQTLGKVKKRKLNKPTMTSTNKSIISHPHPHPPQTQPQPQPQPQTQHLTSTPITSKLLSPNTSLPQIKNHPLPTTNNTPSEPVTEMKDGVEWVSFVYSHNRTLKKYSIRTDLQQVDLSLIDDKFKSENCVYPRANLPKEEYHGNRWAYETECNVLGWKLAWLNKLEIAGKRGLIQRAVDSYRNRYPSMRSRRVARQEKLLNGTLRKRKQRDDDHPTPSETSSTSASPPPSLSGLAIPSSHHPKTIAIEDANHQRFRIKINVESVDLEEMNIEFRKANCPYPRVMNMPKPTVQNTRWLEETMCNELAWKLAWLNPRHLAGKKNMLQRALDIYRAKFMPSLRPRQHAKRVSPIPPPTDTAIPLTADALSAQNALFEKQSTKSSPTMSNSSGTTESLDFADCFSLADEDTIMNEPSVSAAFCDLLLQEVSLFQHDLDSASSSNTSPSIDTTDLFDQFMISHDDPFFCISENSDISKLYHDPFASGNIMDPLF